MLVLVLFFSDLGVDVGLVFNFDVYSTFECGLGVDFDGDFGFLVLILFFEIDSVVDFDFEFAF